MRAGVTMRDPSTVYLDWTVDLGADVTLEPNVILRGATSVGDGSVIGAGSQLIDATIGPVRPSGRASSSRRRSRTRRRVGPFSHLRPGSVVGRGADGRQLRRAQEHASRPGLEAAPHELSRRRRDRRGGQHRRRVDHRQLRRDDASTRRRSATARSSASTRCSSRRSRSARVRAPVPARSSRATCRPASSRSVSRPGSASRGPNPPRRCRWLTSPDHGDRRWPSRRGAPDHGCSTTTTDGSVTESTPTSSSPSSSSWSCSTASSRRPRSRWSRSAAAVSSSSSTRARRRRARPPPQAAARPLPGGHPDRHQLPGLPGVRVRGGQPGRRDRRLAGDARTARRARRT